MGLIFRIINRKRNQLPILINNFIHLLFQFNFHVKIDF